MNQTVFENLEISDVSLERFSTIQLGIHFTIHTQSYLLLFNKVEHVFHLVSVAHNFTETCPFCKREVRMYWVCEELEKHLQDLYHKLVKHPKVRLEFLYIPHDHGGR